MPGNDFPLVSVIIPVYNVEKYVAQCVESVVAQRYPNLEIIVVDDGATDSSGDVCDELASRYENVTCYHKENGGLSDARNYGLARSHGDWISFVDSDDFVSPSFVSSLYEAAMLCDCPIAAVPDGKTFYDDETCELADSLVPTLDDGSTAEMSADAHAVATSALDAHDLLKMMLYQHVATGAQWRLYRRDTLGEDPFPKGLYYEDLASTYKFIQRAGRVALVDTADLYAYRMRRDSIIRQSYRHVKGQSALIVSDQIYRDIPAWYPDLTAAVSSRCFSVCRMVFAQIPRSKNASPQDEADRQALWAVLKKHRHAVTRDPEARGRERLAACIACLGEELFSAFCHLARRMGKMQ